MSRVRRPRLYFSLRSPFSWMALRQLEEQLPDADEHIDYIPFFEPDGESARELEAAGGEFHYVPMSKAKHLYILTDTKRLAGRFGYQMRWPIDVDPSWELPHLAWLKARELGVHREYYRAVMSARWERGEDICDPVALAAIVAAAGLPVQPLLQARTDQPIRDQGLAALMEVYHDDVFGVPYFKLGRQRFWGLDRLPDFLAALLPTIGRDPASTGRDTEVTAALGVVGVDGPATSAPPPHALAAVGAYDRDTAGGCG